MLEFEKLNSLFHPKSVAVLGASLNPASGGNNYARCLLKQNFEGKVYFVNPRHNNIYGLKAYPSLREIPNPQVDYVICCVPAEHLLEQIYDCHIKNVKLIHIFAARMKETGLDERIELENEIVKRCKKFGIRVLGPNCMGLYNPKIGLSYYEDFPKKVGPVGGISQTGGGSAIIIRYAATRGIRFSKVISYGNASDIDESELLRYLAEDDETKIIMVYIEGVRDGRKFLDALSYATKRKPVVVLKGGRGEAGSKATLSHTGSIAGSVEIWKAALKQHGAIQVSSIEELVDVVVALCFLPKINGKRVLVGGGGGGTSVISADVFEEAGFQLPDLPKKVKEKLKNEVPLAAGWLGNPVDSSIIDQFDTSISSIDILKIAGETEDFDITVANFPEDAPVPDPALREFVGEKFLEGVIELKKMGKPIICIIKTIELTPDEMKGTKWEIIAEIRKRLIQEGIPVYSSPQSASKALRKVADYHMSRDKLQNRMKVPKSSTP
ncbi:MAG: acetate--CoA ligase family protein [Candidatus Bathycorpusculaceae bacterium]